jgi:hypothetical protein
MPPQGWSMDRAIAEPTAVFVNHVGLPVDESKSAPDRPRHE